MYYSSVFFKRIVSGTILLIIVFIFVLLGFPCFLIYVLCYDFFVQYHFIYSILNITLNIYWIMASVITS